MIRVLLEPFRNAVFDMSRARAELIAWWLTTEDCPPQLPSKLLTLVRKLDAIEGNHLLHQLGTAPVLATAKTIGEPTTETTYSDWFVCT